LKFSKFSSKNLVNKGVNFEAQNALKPTSTFNFKEISWGVIPPLKGSGGPQFTFLATPLSVITVLFRGEVGTSKALT